MNIANALRSLFPTAVATRDYEVRDDGSGAIIAAWRLVAPQPTASQLQSASDAHDAREAQLSADALGLRTATMAVALTAVGANATGLNPAQVRALLTVLLWERGALDKDSKIRPLAEWGVS